MLTRLLDDGRVEWRSSLPLAPLGLWLASVGDGCVQDWIRLGADGLTIRPDWDCLSMAAIIGIVPAAAIVVMLRKGAPLQPRLTLALAALAVASVANFGLQFAHVRDASIMVLAWHLGDAAALSSLGGWLGERALGWRPTVRRCRERSKAAIPATEYAGIRVTWKEPERNTPIGLQARHACDRNCQTTTVRRGVRLTVLRRANELEAPMGEGPHWHLRSVCAIAVMAKASIAGKTKTRLVPPLTEDEAAMLNTVFLRDAADNILSAAAFANISGWMAYAPVGSEPFFRTHLPESIGLIETVAPTLGECLRHAAATLLRAGHGAVCLINSDSPTLPVGYLVAAATALAAPGDRIVLGPSTDGGYYLIGTKRQHSGLFEDIAWSTDQVFSQTLARAEALGLSVFQLPIWYDVDNAEALQLLVHEVLDGRPFRSVGTPTPATWTRRHLSSLVDESGLHGRIRGGRAASGLS